MYAIVENGSKQYKVEVGSIVKFEKLNGVAGDKVEFNVIMLSDDNGVKLGSDAAAFKAVGEIVEQGKHESLVEQNGVYANLYSLQFRSDETKLVQPIEIN